MINILELRGIFLDMYYGNLRLVQQQYIPRSVYLYCSSITVQISVVSILQQSRESQEIRKGFKILKATPSSSSFEEGKKGSSRLGELAILKDAHSAD